MRLRSVAAAVAACVLVSLVAACSGGGDDPDVGGATDKARAFLRSWSEGKLDQAAAMTDHADAAKSLMQQIRQSLGAHQVDFDAAKATVDGRRARVTVTAHWLIDGLLTPWTYNNQLSLTRRSDSWQVLWSPAVVHPKLKAGQSITVTRTLPPRAQLQDAAGQPLFTPTPVVTVGIEPRRVQDLPGLAQTLAQVLHVSAADITRDVGNADPTQFVPVITVRRPAYEAVRSQIHDLPGTVFSTGTQLLPPITDFGKLLLGKVGRPSAELLKTLGDGYLATDDVGVSGLQAAFNKTLTGEAGAEVEIRQGAKTVSRIGTISPKAGAAVHTTIDRSVQGAADAALATVSQPASIVAIRPSTGAILAVANSPSTPYDIALQGQYPAGSTFKIVTASALLQLGKVRPNAQVACPGQTTVYGKVFHNEDSFDLGTVPLRSAFAHSCNTTFTALSTTLPDRSLSAMAARFGVGAGWNLPMSTFSGSVPAPKDDAERAADAIGQGRVLVSPLTMALVAATVAHGSTPAPSIVTDQAATARNEPDAPSPATLMTVKSFMRATVTEGTATQLASAPGGPVYGKTGTAEFGTATPPHSHAWFAGYRGDVAFAVFVEGGESSKTTAVPIAGSFLNRLP